MRPSLADARRAAHLLNECRDLGATCPGPDGWHAHLVEGLRLLTGAVVGIGGNIDPPAPGRRPQAIGPTIRLGWPTARAEAAWRRYAAEVPVERTPEYTRIASLSGTHLMVTPRTLWGEGEGWHRSPTFNERHRPAGLDDYIMSLAPGPDGRLFNSVWLHRAVGEAPFTRRERWLVRFVHEEIGRMIGLALASPDEPAVEGLSARHRRTLARLLAGDSEKIAAASLGLCPATVHEYVRDLYAHFRVRSRAELLAIFVGRARPRDPARGGVVRHAPTHRWPSR